MGRKWHALWPNDWIIHHDNALAHKELSSSFWPKTRLLKWNTHPVPLTGLQITSGCFQKIKSDLKERILQDTENIEEIWRWLWKLFHNRSSKIVPNSGSITVLLHSCSRGVLRRWTVSACCKYTGMLAIKYFRQLHSHISYNHWSNRWI
jgi:hypothetical protein